MTRPLAGLVLALSLFNCNAIDAAIDCHDICTRYASCYDTSYDTGSCESRCKSHSSSDTEYRSQANQCSACIQDRACASATFSCGTQCLTVVP
jgi:hypothetical protein